jgi:hypothetical protein
MTYSFPTCRSNAFGGIVFWVAVTVLILLVLTPALPVSADIAPPEPPPGINPVPGSENTQVRMLSEMVTLDILPEPSGKGMPVAKVTAVFNMRNLGAAEERMAVRFPLDAGIYREIYPDIQDLRAWVNAREVHVWQSTDLWENSWSNFDVIFPPGKDMQIKVAYTIEASDLESAGGKHAKFIYLLETGTGWKDTIGRAEIILRLPYKATEENVFLGRFDQTTAGGVISDTEVHWKFDDLEPDTSDNFKVVIVKPTAWRKVLNERENVRQNPQDGEAWGRLGKACKEIIVFRRSFRTDDGGLSLLAESDAAYQKAVALLPDDALWHLGYADLLVTVAEWGKYEFPDRDMRPEMLRAVQHIQLAYQFDPREQRIQDLLMDMIWSIPGSIELQGDRYIFLALTATPTLASSKTLTPTETPAATITSTPGPAIATPIPTASLSPSVTPVHTINPEAHSQEPTVVPAQTGLPLGGSLVLFPFLMTLFSPVLCRKLQHTLR